MIVHILVWDRIPPNNRHGVVRGELTIHGPIPDIKEGIEMLRHFMPDMPDGDYANIQMIKVPTP